MVKKILTAEQREAQREYKRKWRANRTPEQRQRHIEYNRAYYRDHLQDQRDKARARWHRNKRKRSVPCKLTLKRVSGWRWTRTQMQRVREIELESGWELHDRMMESLDIVQPVL